MDGIPVLDFHNPWVGLIQLALVYVLPRLTGLISDKWASPVAKAAGLGVLTVLGSSLTWLLDVAVANSWATVDWTDLANVVVNSALTWLVAQQVFDRFLKPSGVAASDATSGVAIIPRSTATVNALVASGTITKAEAAKG